MDGKRGTKARNVDYTHDEFLEEVKVSDRTFRNQFSKMLQMYGLEKRDFKKKKEEKDDYIWPIAWAELAAALVRTFPHNPLFRTNAQIKTITADYILTYYRSLIDEIEYNLPEHLKNHIRSFPAYLPALKLVNSLPRLINKISELAAAVIILGTEQPGDIISYVGKTIDDWIYHLHRNRYYLQLLEDSSKRGNEEELLKIEEQTETDEDKQIVKQRQKELYNKQEEENVPLDMKMVGLLKRYMEVTNYNWTPKDVMEWKEELATIAPFLGMEVITDSTALPEDDDIGCQRLLYQQILEKKVRPTPHQQSMIEAVDHYIEKSEHRQDNREKVQEEITKQKKMTAIEREKGQKIARENKKKELKEQIHICEEKLKKLESKDWQEAMPSNELEMKEAFLDFYQQIERETKAYKDAADLFTGQLLVPQFIRNRPQ